jgi:hypothetical protein
MVVQEDEIYRHVDPPLAFQLELRRLCNYKVGPSSSPTLLATCSSV